jgi:hypothetical protein
MKLVLGILIFCIVLFLYLHIFFHIKTSNDLEVYEIEQPSKDKLEEICDLRQPVLFDFENDNLIERCALDNFSQDYGAFDIKIRNTQNIEDNSEYYIPVTLNASKHLFQNDEEAKFYSENNSDFLEETALIKNYRYNDKFLRPYMVSSCNYDIMIGSKDTSTPLRYELSYRNYYLVTQGEVNIKLIPPKSSKYLYPVKDYDNFEFRSLINPWDVQKQYQPDFDKVKCLEVTLKPGNIINIPAYWWYSIKFSENSSISCFQYKTYMNMISILPQLFMKILQNQNVKREIVKKVNFESLIQESKNKLNTINHTEVQKINKSLEENIEKNK